MRATAIPMACCGVRPVCIRRWRTFANEANLREQPYAGDEANETADRPDIEEGPWRAAISVWAREADHQKGKPEPAGERTEKTRQDAMKRMNGRCVATLESGPAPPRLDFKLTGAGNNS
ncbi:MAG: hypothetical protein WBE48_11605 [Xanthobacteraceae bacterium]